MKKSVATLLSLILWCQVAHAELPTEEDLHACYVLEFQYEEITSDVAFHIGECFSELAITLADRDLAVYEHAYDPGDLTNLNAVLHYAGSWYSRAHFQGHPQAEAQWMLTWDKLTD